ncbi:sporulation protein YunB [Bacillus sp. 1P06AnD]|uniref:sporulation protein YunB n=1 Tax=Bacillus sp. 1P06AnD TaxID=3132208 RepID=UPI0039A00CC3
MKRRWRYRRRTGFAPRGPLGFKKVLLISFILFLILNFLTLWLVDKSITPIIKDVAKTEVKRIATQAIMDSIAENIENQANLDKLIVEEKRDGMAPTYRFDSEIYTTFLTKTTKGIEQRLGIKNEDISKPQDFKEVEANQLDNIVYYIPLGVATRNTILSNLGPKIPVELAFTRDVRPKFRTKMTSGGINNTFLEVFVDFEVDLKIVIPFATEETPIKFETSLGGRFIPGEVPSYYSNGQSIPVPILQDDEAKKKGKKED